MPARILVGSCSWTDPTLISCGRFYPAGVTSAEARLRYYAEQFDIVEVDSTYYAPPTPRNSELWAARTPAGLHLQRQGVRLAHAPRGGAGPAARLAAQPAAGRRARQAHVYARDIGERELELVWQLHREALAPLGRGRQARRGALPVPAVVRALAGEPRTTCAPCPSGCPAGRWRWSSAAAAGWRTRSAARHPAPARGGRADLRGRRRAAGVPQQHAAAGGGHGAARRWCACTGATRTRGRAAPAPPRTASSTCTSDAELEEWVPRVRELAAQSRCRPRPVQQQLRGLGHAERASHGAPAGRGERSRRRRGSRSADGGRPPRAKQRTAGPA